MFIADGTDMVDHFIFRRVHVGFSEDQTIEVVCQEVIIDNLSNGFSSCWLAVPVGSRDCTLSMVIHIRMHVWRCRSYCQAWVFRAGLMDGFFLLECICEKGGCVLYTIMRMMNIYPGLYFNKLLDHCKFWVMQFWDYVVLNATFYSKIEKQLQKTVYSWMLQLSLLPILTNTNLK